MKKLLFLATLCFVALLQSCSLFEQKGGVEYLPFQSEKDGRWGMISTEGKVLFADEFTNQPTVAVNGRFFVQNAEGQIEIYTTDEKPKQIGGQYLGVCDFTEDVTPAVQKGKAVVLIDREGKVVKDLAKIGGKSVSSVFRFAEGRAMYCTSDELFGAIDTEGNIKIEARYIHLRHIGEGKFLAMDKKYKDVDDSKKKVVIIDSNGKVLSEILYEQLQNILPLIDNGTMAVQPKSKRDDEQAWGLMNEKFEWTLKAQTKFQRITELAQKHFIFMKDGKYGLASYDGDVKVRAKYDNMSFCGLKDRVAVADYNKGSTERYALCNLDGEQVGTERFMDIYSAQGGSDYCPVRIGDNEYGFVDADGEIVKLDKGVDLYDLAFTTSTSYVESDYVDAAALVEALAITPNSIDGVALGTTAEAAARVIQAKDGSNSEARSYTYTSSAWYNKEIKPATARIEFYFSKLMAEERYRTEYETYFGYTFSRQVSDGYHFNADSRIQTISASFRSEGKTEGKADIIYEAMKNKVQKMGTTVKSTDHGLIVSLPGGKTLMAYTDGKRASILLSANAADNFVIPDYEKPGAANDGSSYDPYAADTLSVDSLAADSAAAAY